LISNNSFICWALADIFDDPFLHSKCI
jgi:hypothetical protein